MANEKSMIKPTLCMFYFNCEIETISFETVVVYFVLVLITALFATEGCKLSITGIKNFRKDKV